MMADITHEVSPLRRPFYPPSKRRAASDTVLMISFYHIIEQKKFKAKT
jgi:hypothetical protein